MNSSGAKLLPGLPWHYYLISFAINIPGIEAGKGKDTCPVDIAYNLIVYTVQKENAISNKRYGKIILKP
jgi:hypothetical protein